MVSSPAEAAAQNKNAVGKMFEAFGRGDIPYILSQFSDDMVIDGRDVATIPFARLYNGKADCLNYFIGLNEAFETTAFEAFSVIGEGNLVAAFGRHAGKGRTSGKSFDSPWSMYWEFNADGLATKWKGYLNSAKMDAAYKVG